jgi:hypothetical protein
MTILCRRVSLLALGFAVLVNAHPFLAAEAAAPGQVFLRGATAASPGPERSLGLKSLQPLNCVAMNKFTEGFTLDKGDGVCFANRWNAYEFGLTKEGGIIFWHHDYSTNVKTKLWVDPSQKLGSTLRLEPDASLVLYDAAGNQVCKLGGEADPSSKKDTTVSVSPNGVEIKTSSAVVWSVTAEGVATSMCL